MKEILIDAMTKVGFFGVLGILFTFSIIVAFILEISKPKE